MKTTTTTRIIKNNGQITKSKVETSTPIYNVRIKPENYEALVAIAHKNSRSITNQINYILEQFLQNKK